MKTIMQKKFPEMSKNIFHSYYIFSFIIIFRCFNLFLLKYFFIVSFSYFMMLSVIMTHTINTENILDVNKISNFPVTLIFVPF